MVVAGLPVCIAIVWRPDVAVVVVRRSRTSRRRGQSWQQPLVVAVVSRQE